ncbi:reduced folate transporter [Erinaceus europaeus]|uniref:Reduced folate transporter n=1 Tax=Erinaceus europaeus TaxID=9365 RepID=A0ABM3WV83_ERIEU|nr:reduced folate transporter [Erinaceus europaeus]
MAGPTQEGEPGKAWGAVWRSERWQVGFLCFYGFVAQLRPGESFITPYLLSQNFTHKQVTNEITPVLSYTYLAVLVPVFLLTDLLRYTPVLVLQALAFVAVWLLLLLGSSVAHMQLMEACYALTMAARIAYSSYIFSLVRPRSYQRAAGLSRSAVLLGVFASSVLGQLLVSAAGLHLRTLNRVSLGFLLCSLLLSLLLRRPRRSLFFHPPAAGAAPSELCRMAPGPGAGGAERGGWRRRIPVRMLQALGGGLRRPSLRLWSLWWVCSSAGYYLIVYYVHVLWSVVDSATLYNGAADAASTLLGAVTSFAAGFVKIRWAVWGKLVIAAVMGLQAGLVLLMYTSRSIWLCYFAFVLFRGAYQFLVPIATSQIASSLSKELCALAFGVNTFLATVLKTCITLLVSDSRGLGLPVHSQFLIYSIYFLALSALYLLGAVWEGLRHLRKGHPPPLPVAQELSSPAEMAAQDGDLQQLSRPPPRPEPPTPPQD